MGTNYYWRYRRCTSCDRFEEIHIGKSSGTFRAYRNKLLDENHPEWGYETQSPVGFPVVSLSDWRRVFSEFPGELWDEYGKKIEDPLRWLSEALPWDTRLEWRKGWLQKDIREGVGWLDAEGYRFYTNEFS